MSATRTTAGELVISWVQPVLIRRVTLSRLRRAGGELIAYDAAGARINQLPLGQPTGGRWEADLGWAGVTRLDLLVDDPGAEAQVAYAAEGTLVAELDRIQKRVLPGGSWRTVPRQGPHWQPWAGPGVLTCVWDDPVELEQLRLLDVREPGGELIARDGAGQTIWQQKLESRGVNGVQTIRLKQPGVARLELHLAQGGALAELQFAWERRVRSAWQREHPEWARLAYNPITLALAKPEIQYSIKLTLISCTMTAILSLWVAVPIGYLMSRHRFWGRNLIDATLDIPIVLPPLVVGLSLLILFQFFPVFLREAVVYQIPAVILAQFSVACAFAVRTMRATFDQIDSRQEQVALTLGCSRWQAFGMVVLPEARRGILTAATLAWARSLGEFGPLLVFAGTTRNKTEVLSTTVFLELNVGNLGAAVAVSLIMVVAAVAVLVLARGWGTRNLTL
jgi:molybdate transport system permease protein